MNKVMYGLNEIKDKIAQGKKLILAGAEDLVKQLPDGQWIAGTIPYFMAEKGGVCTKEQILATELPPYVTSVTVKKYNKDNIVNVYKDAPGNGFSVIIIPASSSTHFSFALHAPQFDGFATSNLIGWIAGVHLDDLGKISPKIFFGPNHESIEDGAVVMNVGLPENKYAEINLLNLFKQGSGDTIMFPEDGFSAGDVMVNGGKKNLVDYLLEKNVDTKLPLVADYCGAMINTSFQGVDPTKKMVNFYAPVFQGIQYKLAAPVNDYVAAFEKLMPKDNVDRIAFSCNCILNYLYSNLEGKHTGGVTGPITFGEIAYQLLNQTLAYITIGDCEG